MRTHSNKKMSIDNIRIGKKYFVRNHGESTSFMVLETSGHDDFKVKDLLTLDIYQFKDLIQYGVGTDFELFEI